MVIQIAQELGRRLQGRVLGAQHFAKLCEYLADSRQAVVVVLDFKEVLHVTGSWLNSMVVPLFHWASMGENDFFPLFCNVNADWIDDFRLVAGWNHQCYLISSNVELPESKARLIGSLDPAQKECLDVVLREGKATGAELERKMSNEQIKATAWNNRLKALFEKRLLRREKKGREQIYFPLVKEITQNGR